MALAGLASPHWEVRNAGCMCFSALALRMLGFKNDDNQSSVTSSQLSQRFPRLLPILVQHLEAGMQRLVSATALHPALFPILALLSRLRWVPKDVHSSRLCFSEAICTLKVTRSYKQRTASVTWHSDPLSQRST